MGEWEKKKREREREREKEIEIETEIEIGGSIWLKRVKDQTATSCGTENGCDLSLVTGFINVTTSMPTLADRFRFRVFTKTVPMMAATAITVRAEPAMIATTGSGFPPAPLLPVDAAGTLSSPLAIC